MPVEAAILTYTAFVICAFVYSRAIAVAAMMAGVAVTLAMILTDVIDWTGCPEMNGRNEDGEPIILDRCR
jgi:hypothetical protein